ncbi:hypothetical protein BC829DRAFT_167885 [Chytridium lagenaria]|nr:hypothetical protein BC829DRAFT_167885 [Chytridium lagenaria]
MEFPFPIQFKLRNLLALLDIRSAPPQTTRPSISIRAHHNFPSSKTFQVHSMATRSREMVSTLESTYAWDDLGVIMDPSSNEVSLEDLPRFLGLYFAAGWSASCRTFTPKLESLTYPYRHSLTIIHMTSDASPFHTVRRTPSIISSHNAARNLLGLPYIPALVIVDRVERRVVTSAGVPALNINGRGQLRSGSKDGGGFRCGVC